MAASEDFSRDAGSSQPVPTQLKSQQERITGLKLEVAALSRLLASTKRDLATSLEQRKKATSDAERARQTLARLRARRSVRVATGFVAPASPLFRLARRIRGRRIRDEVNPVVRNAASYLGYPMPPASLRFMGKSDADYLEVGEAWAIRLEEYAGLKPGDAILDIGCGYGRTAHALIRRGHRGTYLGMDILPRHIAWCSDYLTPASQGRFEFQHLDVRNGRYNPGGVIDPEEVSLNFDGQADVVILTSVFTHMYASTIEHYLAEIVPLMAEGGRMLATFFLMNDSQRQLEEAGLSKYPLAHEISPTCRYWSPEDPLHVIAYDEGWVRQVFAAAGLRVDALYEGNWCGRQGAVLGQDTFVVSKVG